MVVGHSCQMVRGSQNETVAPDSSPVTQQFILAQVHRTDRGRSVESEKVTKYAGPYGQLTPTGGGDPIPLIKKRLIIGRRNQTDIQLQFKNVSGQHCRLSLESGYWFVHDLNSRNGTKVDGHQVMRKRIDPGCKLSVARHEYVVEYEPQELGAYGTPPADDDFVEELMKSSLMEKAGLRRRRKGTAPEE